MQNKKFIFLFVLLLSFICRISKAQPTEAVVAYITQYKDLAISEMKRTGVPASITLAQGIHETDAGNSILVRKSNNHFGIKCKSNWVGASVSHDDDARGECFRKYTAPEDSYKDHSDFLKGGSRYAFLFTLDPLDYEGWCYGLKKAGYATNPKYSQVLIKLIRDYNLQDYTLIAMGKLKQDEFFVKNEVIADRNGDMTRESNNVITEQRNNKEVRITDIASTSKTQHVTEEKAVMPAASITPNYPQGEFRINETRVVFVKKGTSFLTVAQQYEIPLARLFEFNEMKELEVAVTDQLIFIQRKRKTGDNEYHVVQPGETIYSIAQSEAIRLESLLEYNWLKNNMEPATGETLFLRVKAPGMPKLVEIAGKNPNVPLQSLDLVFHKVQPKETVYSIAKKYNVSFDDVINWNQLQGHDLRIGQSLKIFR